MVNEASCPGLAVCSSASLMTGRTPRSDDRVVGEVVKIVEDLLIIQWRTGEGADLILEVHLWIVP